ncbi:MAG: dihydrolipoyl dehydrogenase, partial [Gammaproteobacteria bacterium]
MSRVDLTIPDIGNFTDVSVVDVLVKAGDVIAIDSPLVTLETDKASMDVPATAAGTIAEVLLKRGDKVSKGSLIARVEAGTAAVSAASPSAATSAPAARQVPGPEPRPAAPPASRAPAARRESAGDTVRMPTPGSGAADRASQDFNRSTQLLV